MKTPPLGYSFAPLPKYLLRDRTLSDRGVRLLAVVYGRADTTLLARREPTPRLPLEQIAEAIGWTGNLTSLQRWLARLRERGYFDYSVEGHSKFGLVYVFALHADGLKLSAQRPPNSDAACPPKADAQGESPGEIAADSREDVSGQISESNSPTRPPGGTACPPIGDAATPDAEPLSTLDDGDACPPTRDVREKANLSTTEAVAEGGLTLDPVDGEEAVLSETEKAERLIERVDAVRDRSLADGMERARRAAKRREWERSIWPEPPQACEASLLDDCEAMVVAGHAEWEDKPQ